MRKYKVPDFKVGDKVAYSVQWLRSTGQGHSEVSHARGIVTSIGPLIDNHITLLEIDWGSITTKVLDDNLALVGPNPRFANVD